MMNGSGTSAPDWTPRERSGGLLDRTLDEVDSDNARLRAEVERLREGLEMIRDREALEPSDYIAAYGEPVGSPGDLARTVLEGDK